MARAIDADALQELCDRRIQDTWNSGTAPVSWAHAYADFKDDIDSMPTLTPQNEWVSVEKRLPELPEKDWCSKMVISCDKNGHVAPMILERAQVRGKMIERWKYHWDRIYDGAGITHWMPLPAPPGEGNNVPNEAPNDPLTLKELREMDGVNALWVHNLAFGLHKPRFMLVKNVSEDWWTCCDFDGFKTFCAADYGERYLLYRRPPEVSP